MKSLGKYTYQEYIYKILQNISKVSRSLVIIFFLNLLPISLSDYRSILVNQVLYTLLVKL